MQMRGISFLLFFSEESYERFHFKTDNGRLQCRLLQIWDVRFKHHNKTRTKSQLGMICFFKSDGSFSLKLVNLSSLSLIFIFLLFCLILTVSMGLLTPSFLNLSFNLFMNLSFNLFNKHSRSVCVSYSSMLGAKG